MAGSKFKCEDREHRLKEVCKCKNDQIATTGCKLKTGEGVSRGTAENAAHYEKNHDLAAPAYADYIFLIHAAR